MFSESRAKYDTRKMESRLVGHLVYDGPQTYHQIAEYYGLPHETTLKVIRNLIKRGLLTKTSDGKVIPSETAAYDYMATPQAKAIPELDDVLTRRLSRPTLITAERLLYALVSMLCADTDFRDEDYEIYDAFSDIKRIWDKLPLDKNVPDIITQCCWGLMRIITPKNEAQK